MGEFDGDDVGESDGSEDSEGISDGEDDMEGLVDGENVGGRVGDSVVGC